MESKPIPAFYCCYLLRSTIRHASLYIGSTPNPRRRLAQHNGKVKGGAARTCRVSLRPWEMTCVVAGFPSNIAALQFEWAWQNPHLTRHIPHHERISFPTIRTLSSPSTEKTRRRPGRPKSSLTEKLSNLHLLLRVPYFSQWPLEIRFFADDVYQLWQTWGQRVDNQLPSGINVFLDKGKRYHDPGVRPDFESLQNRRQLPEPVDDTSVNNVDASYMALRPVLEKSMLLVEDDEAPVCSLCTQNLSLSHDLMTVCPQELCQSVHHLECLANHFLRNEKTTPSLIPRNGQCPSCKVNISWVDCMKELTLRDRGRKEVSKILKRRKETPLDAQTSAKNGDVAHDLCVSDTDNETVTAADVVDEEFDDGSSVTSTGSDISVPSRFRTASKGAVDLTMPIIIEDSDADAVEYLSD